MQASSRAYRAYTLTLIVAIYACNFVDRMIISVVAYPVQMELKLSDFQLGVLGGFAFALFYSILSIPLARLAERKSRVAIITVCLGLWSLFTALGGLAQNFTQLLLSRIGVGVGEAGFVAPAQSLLADEYPPERRAFAISIFSLGPPLGILIGGLAGGWITQAYGWRWALVLVGLPGILIALIAWATLREPVRGRWDGAQAAEAPGASLLDVCRTIVKTPTLALIALAGIATNFAGFGLFPFLPIFMMRRFDMSAGEAGAAVGLMIGIGGSLGAVLGAPLAAWVGRRAPQYYLAAPAAALLVSVPLLAAGFLQSSAAACLVLLVIPEILKYTYLGPSFGAVHNLVGPRERASTIALIYLLMSLVGMGLGPLFTGAVSDHLTEAAYAGDFIRDCQGDASSAACRAASVEGLRSALILTSGVFVLAAAALFAASRRLSRDLAARNLALAPLRLEPRSG